MSDLRKGNVILIRTFSGRVDAGRNLNVLKTLRRRPGVSGSNTSEKIMIH